MTIESGQSPSKLFGAQHQPSTFEERGTTVPFTTPTLSCARVRSDDRHNLVLLTPGFAGTQSVYVLPWKAIPDLVTMTIHQYDSGGALNNPWFAKVAGTVDGTVTITEPSGKTETVTQWDPNNVGHTFTMRSVPGVDSNFFLNVPLPTNADLPNDANNQDAGQSYTVTFSFMSGNKGSYAWNCEFPCGQMVASFGGVMSAYGFMSGFVHVV